MVGDQNFSLGYLFYRCCGLFKKKTLQAHWTVQSEFTELIVEDGIIEAHMPYTILKHLITLQKQYK